MGKANFPAPAVSTGDVYLGQSSFAYELKFSKKHECRTPFTCLVVYEDRMDLLFFFFVIMTFY